MYQKGDVGLAKHHAVVMPSIPFGNCPMNATYTTSGGYVASDMYTKCMPLVDENLEAVFGNHLLQFKNCFTNSTNTAGAADGSGWYFCKSFLLSEVEVYGSTVVSSSGYDVGTGNRQFSAFRFNPRLISNQRTVRWLRSICSDMEFCAIDISGNSIGMWASGPIGVWPAFLIG